MVASPTIYWYHDWYGVGAGRALSTVHLRNQKEKWKKESICGATISTAIEIRACDLERADSVTPCPNCVRIARDRTFDKALAGGSLPR